MDDGCWVTDERRQGSRQKVDLDAYSLAATSNMKTVVVRFLLGR